MIEQCLGRKAHLNKQHLTVFTLRQVVESVIEFIDKELGIRKIQTGNAEEVEACLKKELCKSIQLQVKNMIREYLRDLAVKEKKQEKREERRSQGTILGRVPAPYENQKPTQGALDSFDASK
jgi:hypothetical protein